MIENMAQAALLGHAKAKSKKNKARISKALSDHAVDNTWWEPSSLPDWLTEQCYMLQIQPRLRTIKVREISEALRVSKPYAARGPQTPACAPLGDSCNARRFQSARSINVIGIFNSLPQG
jgi:hypothetical protein